MRKVFIDCGANDGDDIRNFLKIYEKKEYDIFAFECHDECISALRSLKKKIDFTLIEKAISTRDDVTTFYMGKSTKSGSIMKEKKKLMQKDKTYTVESIDFSNWLSANFSKDDYIILNFDIEGAEYDILEKMIEQDTISLIDEFYLEFHLYQCKSDTITAERQARLLSKLKEIFDDKLYVCKIYQHEKFLKMNTC